MQGCVINILAPCMDIVIPQNINIECVGRPRLIDIQLVSPGIVIILIQASAIFIFKIFFGFIISRKSIFKFKKVVFIADYVDIQLGFKSFGKVLVMFHPEPEAVRVGSLGGGVKTIVFCFVCPIIYFAVFKEIKEYRPL